MGIDKLDAGLAPFGYGQLTGIDISGEKPGLLPSPAWKKAAFKNPGRPGLGSRVRRSIWESARATCR